MHSQPPARPPTATGTCTHSAGLPRNGSFQCKCLRPVCGRWAPSVLEAAEGPEEEPEGPPLGKEGPPCPPRPAATSPVSSHAWTPRTADGKQVRPAGFLRVGPARATGKDAPGSGSLRAPCAGGVMGGGREAREAPGTAVAGPAVPLCRALTEALTARTRGGRARCRGPGQQVDGG